MIDKKAKPTKLLWVDLEMTGLDPVNDVILEAAAIVTDFDFNILATYEARVQQPKDLVESQIKKTEWWNDYPENRDDFINNLDQGKSAQQVQQELIDLVAEHFGDEPAVLAGNSIHNDRKFIARSWPELDSKLHYRMLDVSAYKVFMQGKYGLEFEKKGLHRALDDIQASIAELQYYLTYFEQHGSQDS